MNLQKIIWLVMVLVVIFGAIFIARVARAEPVKDDIGALIARLSVEPAKCQAQVVKSDAGIVLTSMEVKPMTRKQVDAVIAVLPKTLKLKEKK